MNIKNKHGSFEKHLGAAVYTIDIKDRTYPNYATDKQIDRLVYHLYNLTNNEIKIIGETQNKK